MPTTYLYTSFYWDNLVHFGLGPKRNADGVLSFTLPMGTAKMPGIAAEDIGHCALELFKKGERTVGTSVGISGEHLSGGEMAAALSRALGEPVLHADVSPATYRSFGFPGADDLGNMFQFKREFEREFRNARDLDRSRSLYPKLQTFATWLGKNAGKIPRS
ncbi:MAG: NmrA family NAD(P)-binding protein [Pseudomonadota bacterium]